jgi:hypothetical protein
MFHVYAVVRASGQIDMVALDDTNGQEMNLETDVTSIEAGMQAIARRQNIAVCFKLQPLALQMGVDAGTAPEATPEGRRIISG